MQTKFKTCLVVFLLVFTISAAADFSDFAVNINDYQGDFGSVSLYNEPTSTLGKPTTICKVGETTFRVKLSEPPYNVDTDDNKVITTINPKEFSSDPNNYITVQFDHKVVDYPKNLFGIDLIVFGNSILFGNGYTSNSTNLNTYILNGTAGNERVHISVAQYPDGPWYSFDNGPYGDTLFPTQAYFWDRENAQWTDDEMDFTKPVDPNLELSDFYNISAADAIDLYDGSGGGTGFDLQNLTDYNNLVIDANSGYRWIQFVRLEGGDFEQDEDNNIGGEIDAVSDVAACGDPTHPYPIGDLNKDCWVDFADFALFAQNWLKCTYDCN